MIKNYKNPIYFLIIIATTLLLQLPELKQYVILDRIAVDNNEWWRVVTGNIVHTNLYHWGMNIGALFLIFMIFKPKLIEFEIIGTLLCLAVGISILAHTDIMRYSGLSGVLHGIFAYYVMKELFMTKFEKLTCLMLIGLIIKITVEQTIGSSGYVEEIINAKVATEAHLYGAIYGVLISIIAFAFKVLKNKKKKQ